MSASVSSSNRPFGPWLQSKLILRPFKYTVNVAGRPKGTDLLQKPFACVSSHGFLIRGNEISLVAKVTFEYVSIFTRTLRLTPLGVRTNRYPFNSLRVGSAVLVAKQERKVSGPKIGVATGAGNQRLTLSCRKCRQRRRWVSGSPDSESEPDSSDCGS